MAQPAAAASDMLWPERLGKKEPPITAIGVNLYKCLSSPKNEGWKTYNEKNRFPKATVGQSNYERSPSSCI